MNSNILFWALCWLAGLFFAPLLPGIIQKTKAFFAGRKGQSVFQLYYDLNKLLKKESVRTTTSGGVLKLAPVISLAALLIAGLFLPFGGFTSPAGFTGDIILFFYLLGTARMAQVLGALDTGSSFEGMGSSREMQFSALAETVVFAVIIFLALFSGRSDLNLLPQAEGAHALHHVSILFTAAAFFILLLMENCRVPADDPETHLELTMIHEAMILDYAGPDLALILYGAAMKFYLFASFLVLFVMPVIENRILGAICFFAGVIAVAVLTGIVESSMARYRFLKVPQMLAGALGAALLGTLFLILFEGGF